MFDKYIYEEDREFEIDPYEDLAREPYPDYDYYDYDEEEAEEAEAIYEEEKERIAEGHFPQGSGSPSQTIFFY